MLGSERPWGSAMSRDGRKLVDPVLRAVSEFGDVNGLIANEGPESELDPLGASSG